MSQFLVSFWNIVCLPPSPNILHKVYWNKSLGQGRAKKKNLMRSTQNSLRKKNGGNFFFLINYELIKSILLFLSPFDKPGRLVYVSLEKVCRLESELIILFPFIGMNSFRNCCIGASVRRYHRLPPFLIVKTRLPRTWNAVLVLHLYNIVSILMPQKKNTRTKCFLYYEHYGFFTRPILTLYKQGQLQSNGHC